MINNKHFQTILKVIQQLAYSRDTWEIFYDFLEISAICISNAIDLRNVNEREKQYLTAINKYTPQHQILFSDMFVALILLLEHEFQTGNFIDVLGNLFHELELHNKYKGQFFTPQHICTMMGKILLGENGKMIQERGYISILEPTCGSGAMILGFAQAMKDCGYNHSQQLLVSAVDIDLKCIYMCYLQLSLYGIPAVVIHGNSLTNEVWSRWYTPVYILDGWGWKSRRADDEQPRNASEEAPAEVTMPSSQEAIKAYEQLKLFTD